MNGIIPRSASSPVLSVSATSLLLILWQFGSDAGIINSVFLPSPLSIGTTLVEETINGGLAYHLKASATRLLISLPMGVFLGLLTGLIIHLSSFMRSLLSPWVSNLFAVPKIALFPLFILWLGTGESSRLAMIVVGVALPTAIYTWNALDQVDSKWRELGAALRLPLIRQVQHILLPAALPSILTGIRLAATIAIILLTAAEMLGAPSGIGYCLMNAGNLALVENMMAGIVLLMLLANGISLLLSLISQYLLRWME